MLQCGTETGEEMCEWLPRSTLESLAELNEESLELLAAQAEHSPADLALQHVAQRWHALDAAARRRAGASPYLLLDADFADPARWTVTSAGAALHPFFGVAAAQPLAQAIFAFAWHLSRSQPAAARLLLGLPASGAARLAASTLREVRALALAHQGRLRPRWWQRPAFWRALLGAAAGEDAALLQRVRTHGQTLLAAGLHRAPVRAVQRPAATADERALCPAAPSAA